jgi:hypothetical protein
LIRAQTLGPPPDRRIAALAPAASARGHCYAWGRASGAEPLPASLSGTGWTAPGRSRMPVSTRSHGLHLPAGRGGVCGWVLSPSGQTLNSASGRFVACLDLRELEGSSAFPGRRVGLFARQEAERLVLLKTSVIRHRIQARRPLGDRVVAGQGMSARGGSRHIGRLRLAPRRAPDRPRPGRQGPPIQRTQPPLVCDRPGLGPHRPPPLVSPGRVAHAPPPCSIARTRRARPACRRSAAHLAGLGRAQPPPRRPIIGRKARARGGIISQQRYAAAASAPGPPRPGGHRPDELSRSPARSHSPSRCTVGSDDLRPQARRRAAGPEVGQRHGSPGGPAAAARMMRRNRCGT